MVYVVGHRGAAGLAPENTLAGFRRAVELGVDGVECDVHATGDGRLVVMHDETVDRTTGGSGRIAEMDFSAVRSLDAGGGERPPTLEEVLEAVQGRCELLCELKADGTEAPAVAAVAARRMQGDCIFISFSFQRLANVRRLADGPRVGALLAVPRARDMERAADLGAELVGIHYGNVSLSALERAREMGLRTDVWTPNELPEMQAMIALGVDMISTDRPDILLDYLKDDPPGLRPGLQGGGTGL